MYLVFRPSTRKTKHAFRPITFLPKLPALVQQHHYYRDLALAFSTRTAVRWMSRKDGIRCLSVAADLEQPHVKLAMASKGVLLR
jgi:hypothetical protein